jgi:hypothetical protein
MNFRIWKTGREGPKRQRKHARSHPFEEISIIVSYKPEIWVQAESNN